MHHVWLVVGVLGSFEVEGEQPCEDLLVRSCIRCLRPAVGGEDGCIELAVGDVEPCGALVVEVGEGALLELRFADAVGWRVEPALAQVVELACGPGDGRDER